MVELIKKRIAEVRWWHVLMLLGLASVLPLTECFGRSQYAYDRKIARSKSDLAVLAGAIDQFQLDVGRYPTHDEGLSVLRDRPLHGGKGWRGPYLKNDLFTDPWDHPYLYRLGKSQSFQHYTVTCLGADGQPGGVGVDADLVDGG